jgi:malate dehydrogenase
MKVSVIGAGNVGATVANEIARKDFAREVILIDTKEGVTEGKALDMWQTSSVQGFTTRISGAGTDYRRTAGSDVAVITAGFPRKPGMSRDDLISVNAKIVKEATENVIRYSPDTIIIVVSNPLDVMTYAAWLASGIDPARVFGMAGILDTARYKAFIAEELNISPRNIHALIMGGHGDTMVPLPRYTTISSIPVTEFLPENILDAIIERTKKGGGELVSLMGTSAWYAPGAAAAQMVEAVGRDQKHVFPVCTRLNGEYGLKDIFLGAPVILGKNGVEKVIELNLNKSEKELLAKSAHEVRSLMHFLDSTHIFSAPPGHESG